MKFHFTKNSRGFSEKAFFILRLTVVNSAKVLFKPIHINPENIPAHGPCFLYGNHSNYYDPFVINVAFPSEPTAGVMTREQFHKRLPALFMDSIGIVPTSKYVPEPGVVRSVIKMIDQKRKIVIFPEGGRRWDGKPKPLIESTLKLFYRMGIPIHPVQIHGSYVGWPRWADYPRPGSVEMHWMKPIKPSDYSDYNSFASYCKELLNFDEYYPPNAVFRKFAYKPASGIERLIYRCPLSGIIGSVYSPDGHHVCSRTSNMKFQMDANSRLFDENGKEFSIISMFDEINQFPIDVGLNGVILEAKNRPMFKMGDQFELIRLPYGSVTLFQSHLNFSVKNETSSIPIEDIKYISIEENHKLSITTSQMNLQIDLEGSSALAWQIYIRRLQKET